jgi:hypothetical protein
VPRSLRSNHFGSCTAGVPFSKTKFGMRDLCSGQHEVAIDLPIRTVYVRTAASAAFNNRTVVGAYSITRYTRAREQLLKNDSQYWTLFDCVTCELLGTIKSCFPIPL